MKNITFPQALVCVACLAAPIVAYKLLGSAEAMAALSSLGILINFFLGRDGGAPPPPDPPSGGGKIAGFVSSALFAFMLAGCMEAKSADDVDEHCRGEARAAYYVGEKSEAEAIAVYRECMARHGL